MRRSEIAHFWFSVFFVEINNKTSIRKAMRVCIICCKCKCISYVLFVAIESTAVIICFFKLIPLASIFYLLLQIGFPTFKVMWLTINVFENKLNVKGFWESGIPILCVYNVNDGSEEMWHAQPLLRYGR